MKLSLPVREPVEHAVVKGDKCINIGFVSVTRRRTECDVKCTVEQYMRWHKGDEHVQNIFPLLDADMRELFVTGMGPGEWAKMFADA